MKRRQLLKVAGLGAVGSMLGCGGEPAAPGQEAAPAKPAGAAPAAAAVTPVAGTPAAPKTLNVALSGLMVLEHGASSLVSRLIASRDHRPRLVARMLDVQSQPVKPAEVVVSPSGVQFGVWDITDWQLSVKGLGGGGVKFDDDDPEKCPTTAAHWAGRNRLIDLKYLDAGAQRDPAKGPSTFTLTLGRARCTRPQNVVAGGYDWEFTDERTGQVAIKKPLSDLVRVTVDYAADAYVLVGADNEEFLALAPAEGEAVDIAIFNLPKPHDMASTPPPTRDLPHTNTLLDAVQSPKKYKTVGTPCSGTVKPNIEPQAKLGIEPVFCPPGYLPV